eukprot:Gb_04487 [translate_table: standard]
MGGGPVITESSVLSMEEDVRVILEDSGLLPFFKKFIGHSEAIIKQFVDSWKNRRVTINGLDIDVNEGLIAEFNSKRYGLPAGPSRGAANRISGVPITKFQLLIGLAPPSLHLTSVDSESDAEEDSESQGMVSVVTIPKEKEGQWGADGEEDGQTGEEVGRVNEGTHGQREVVLSKPARGATAVCTVPCCLNVYFSQSLQNQYDVLNEEGIAPKVGCLDKDKSSYSAVSRESHCQPTYDL